LSVFKNVLGGTAALHVHRTWGAVLFSMHLESPRRQQKFSWPLALALIALITAGLAAFIFFRLETWPIRTAKAGASELERLGKNVRDAFVEVAQLQPRVVINNRVYFEKSTETAELTILLRQIEVENEFQHTWAGSTKRIKLHGTFTASAGFDLRQDVTVELHSDRIDVRLPHASILGVEQKAIEILEFENGFWNRISATDLQKELSVLPDLARQRAVESGILAEAEATFKKQLDQRVHPDRPFNVTFRGPVRKE
jgi:hypothetical protein